MMLLRPLTRVAFVCLLALAGGARAQLLELVTDDISGPMFVANAGDDRLFVVARAGRIFVVENGSVLPTPFLEIEDDVSTAGEGGLLSMAFDPDYASNGRVFVYYTDNETDSVLARYTRSAGNPNTLDPDSGEVVLEIDQSPTFNNHRGGTIAFGPDDMLYWALGDGGGPSEGDPDCEAQRTDSLLGKMLRLDVDRDAEPWYVIPNGNPFDDEIWSLGFRNPFRFSFDRNNGDLWIGDVGGDNREEVNREPASAAGGRNYGWAREEGSFCLVPEGNPPSCPAVPQCGDSAYTRPVFEYNTRPGGHAVTGGVVYRGESAPGFRGRYIFADAISDDIWALSADAPYDAERLGEVGTPVGFGEDADGELYLATLSGSVYRVRLDRVEGGGGSDPVAACVNAANARVSKYAKAAEKDTRECASLAAKEKLGERTLDQCVVADRKGALAKQQTQLENAEAKHCELTPAFGFAGSEVAGAAAEAAGQDLAVLAFGPNLDAAFATKTEDKLTSACQQAVLKGLSSCQNARRKEFLRCKKAGLKSGEIDSAEALAECLSSDPAGRIAKACAKLETKTLPKKCAAPGVALGAAFPGCDEDDVADLAACLDAAGRCAHCRTFSAADALDVDCDAFDDSLGNDSCEDP